MYVLIRWQTPGDVFSSFRLPQMTTPDDPISDATPIVLYKSPWNEHVAYVINKELKGIYAQRERKKERATNLI